MGKNFFFFIVFQGLNSCVNSQNKQFILHTGLVTIKTQSYFYTLNSERDTIIEPMFSDESKAWFCDSIIVQELTTIKIIQNSSEKKQFLAVEGYRYTNLMTKSVYEYYNFSDTAKFYKKCSFDDTVKLYRGWKFKEIYNMQDTLSFEKMTDTVIENINYKRFKSNFVFNRANLVKIYYIRCDKQRTVFDYNKRLSDMTGCPIVKTFSYAPAKNSIPYESELIYVSDSLTAGEQKVFKAWEENERRFPVK